MSIQQVPDRELSYHLISFDKHGRERQDDPDGIMSDRAVAVARDGGVTDVFVLSHGWKGDIPAAIDQYDRWITAMADCAVDRQQVRALRPAFKSLIVGFHWPSQPWGDEEFGGDGSFSIGAAGAAAGAVATGIDQLIDAYADRIADTPRARAALRTILDGALRAGPVVTGLPPDMAAAYSVLDAESGMGAGGPAADPDRDREPFDPNTAFENAVADEAEFNPQGAAFGGGGVSALLSPLRQLSFWKMKGRARTLGETAGFTLLQKLMTATNGRDVRFHLMGHSFGCIVVTSMVNGPGGAGVLVKPVSSMTLVQGATSLWGFCRSIPDADKPGHFWPVISGRKVSGPILTTRSEHDTAVGRFYPLAAGVARQTAFAPGEFPKYGGIGAFGIQGPGVDVTELAIENAAHSYGFRHAHVYNLECSSVINEGGGASGAHSDIAKREVAHAMWEAVKVP